MRIRFLKWFNKHHRFYGDMFSIIGVVSLFGLFHDVLSGDYWRQFLLVLWLVVFAISGHVFMEEFFVDQAEALGE